MWAIKCDSEIEFNPRSFCAEAGSALSTVVRTRSFCAEAGSALHSGKNQKQCEARPNGASRPWASPLCHVWVSSIQLLFMNHNLCNKSQVNKAKKRY